MMKKNSNYDNNMEYTPQNYDIPHFEDEFPEAAAVLYRIYEWGIRGLFIIFMERGVWQMCAMRHALRQIPRASQPCGCGRGRKFLQCCREFINEWVNMCQV